MGSSTSRPDVAGYRVMRVELNSPASTAADAAELPWVPYLDVLTHAGGVDLSQDPTVLTSQLQEHIGRELVLTVVNAKSKLQREITVRLIIVRGQPFPLSIPFSFPPPPHRRISTKKKTLTHCATSPPIALAGDSFGALGR